MMDTPASDAALWEYPLANDEHYQADQLATLNQQLLEVGLLSAVRPPVQDFVPFTPVPVIGQPVSETIIEERR